MKQLLIFTCLCFFTIACYAEDTVTAETEASKSDVYKSLYFLDKGLDQQSFKQMIEQRFAATNRFYMDLSEKQQESIYSYYQETQDFGKIRNKIFELFFTIS
jgi:hypothetical protein